MGSQTPDIGPDFVVVPSLLMTQHNLGGLVDLVFVRVGNEVMAGALGKLESALAATQKSLVALTDLQLLHNQIAIGAKSALSNYFNFTAFNQTITITSKFTTTDLAAPPITTTTLAFTNFIIPYNTTTTLVGTINSSSTATLFVGGSADSYIAGYNLIASTYYGNPIDPYWSVTVPGQLTATPITAAVVNALSPEQLTAYNYFKDKLLDSRASLSGLIANLTPLTPRLKDAAGNDIPGPDGEDPTTLLAKLKAVYNSIPSGGLSAASSYIAIKAWALDGYTTHGASGIVKAGLLQQGIQSAITAGQSLNSSQNASVRNYMFVFEQYYQAAASIMASLNQAIMGMSRKISG